MAVTVKNIIPARLCVTASTVQYTASSGKVIIDKFTVTNTSGSAQTINVHLVPPAGIVGVGNRITSVTSVAPDESKTLTELIGHALEVGGTIVTSSSASSLTIMASGREIT